MPSGARPARPIRLQTSWMLILLFESAALVVRSSLDVYLRDSGWASPLSRDVSYLAVPPILLVLMLPVLRRDGRAVLALFRRQDLSLRLLLIGLTLGVALRLAFWGALIAAASFGLLPRADVPAATGPTIAWRCPSSPQMLLGITVAVLLIPAIEETINRGFFLYGLLPYGRTVAIVVSAMLFAVCHTSPSAYLAFGGGLFFAAATLNSGTLWPATIAHAAYNLAAKVDWRCLHIQWYPQETTALAAGVGALAAGLLLAGLMLSALLVSPAIIGARTPR